MKQVLIPALLLASASAWAQNADSRPLVTNEEADTYAIAEQLYTQARSPELDSVSRRSAMKRAGELFADFLKRFPKSSRYQKALYQCAVCQSEAGEDAAANKSLAKLANETHGEYAAAAAYKLATQAAARNLNDTARGYFLIVLRETKRDNMKHAAIYRLGIVELAFNNRAEAESRFRSIMVMPGVAPDIMQASIFALAQMKVEDGKDEEAYGLFLNLLNRHRPDDSIRGKATLQAARLASRLGKSTESQNLYNRLTLIPGMEKYAAEAQIETITQLYKAQKYAEVVSNIQQKHTSLDDKNKEAVRALIVGQSYMELKDYERAAEWFAVAEEAKPRTEMAADAGYRRVVCVQQMRSPRFITVAQHYLSTYAKEGAVTVDLPCVHLVRYMYADRLMLADVKNSARQFDVLNPDRLPDSVRADATYKKAWTAAQAELGDPIGTLDHFIATYPTDKRLADALALRGRCLVKDNKVPQALKDFDRVIKEFPDSSAAPVCWQSAAQACSRVQKNAEMVKYYTGLIKCGGRVKPIALAEAHYNIACALYETDPAKAVVSFEEARTQEPGQYANVVGLRLVQCYFKLQNAPKLTESLRELEKTNEASYKALPPAILRWAGWSCFQARDYISANKYMSDSLAREGREKYTDAEGKEQTRPKVEPLVWKTLAKARLELHLYEQGLEASGHYLDMEQQPYRKAEGMRDRAQLLIGLGRAEEAKEVCEAAIALGIDGPVKSAVFITLGDAYYVMKKYDDAAKTYGRVANVVSDKDLQPLSLYKITCALKKGGKPGEAAGYEETLKTRFPGWNPPPAVTRFMEERKE
ncbi:MAG: tol-pal system YbgF family protein [Akkermansia sp.]